MSQIRPRLSRALREKNMVRFIRPFEQGSVSGYVVDIGPLFFMVAMVGDGIRLNGFQCFRLSDVRRLQVPFKYAAFYEAALKKRGQRRPRKPRVTVSSLAKLLVTAGAAFPLVTIHRERVDPDICNIGRVVGIGRDTVSLLEIGPDAVWGEKPETYRLREITRVDFGGDYEEALHLVGDSPGAKRVHHSTA